MTRAWTHRSPDAHLRDIQYARDREEERAARLDKRDNQRLLNIQAQMETERQRGADLNQRDSIAEQMRFEQERGAELDRRDRERPWTPPVSEWMPQRDEAAALRRLDPHAEYLRGIQAAQERGESPLIAMMEGRMPPQPRQGFNIPPPLEAGAQQAIKGVQYIEEPVAAAALQAVSRTGPLGGPALGPSQQIGETPMERAPIGEELVNPARAWLGDEEEQRKAREVLEEAGLPASIIAQVITSPLNLLPIAGVTKVDDFVRLLKLAGKATGPARQSVVRSHTFQEAIKGIREAGERGGPKMPGVGPEDVARVTPSDTALAKLRAAGQQAPENWVKNLRLSRKEFGVRAEKAKTLRDKLISQGVPEQEAILKSTAELRGEHPFKAATGIDFTAAEEAWFYDQLTQGLQYGETVNVATYMQKTQQQILAGQPIKDFPPFIWRHIERAFSEDFTNQLKQAVKNQVKASEAELMAKAPAGVTPGPPVPTSKGAEQAVFHPEFPAPGATIGEVVPEKGAPLIDTIADSVGVLRPILASSDISWFRQTAKTIGRHPLISRDSLVQGTKAFPSEKSAVEWMNALKAEGVTADGYRQVVRTPGGVREIGLGRLLEDRFMAVPGTPEFAESGIMARPEFYASKVAANLPLVRQSGRAFGIGWNTQYAGVSRYWLNKATRLNGGVLDQGQVDAVLNLAERLTGRGELGTSWFAKALKALGFAPGYRISGPQAFTTLLSPRTDRLVRRMAAEELVTWATLGGSIMTAAKYGAGATVVTGIGASQFGRIKFPGSDTYYNIWGTDNVLARAILQTISQQRVDVRGNISRVGSGEPTPQGFLTAMRDSLETYLRSGEDPVVGLISDLHSGETYLGKKLHWDIESAWQLVQDRLPMAWQDMADMFQTDGPLQTILSAPAAVTGTAGISSWTPTRETFRAMPKYESSDKGVVEDVLDSEVLRPLNLTSNEERDLLRFLRDDVREWIEEKEDKHGPMPSEVSMVQVIQKVGQEKGLSSREIAGAIFLHRGKARPAALNPEWIKFALQHRAELEDYYPETYEADYMQAAQQAAEERGLVPVR